MIRTQDNAEFPYTFHTSVDAFLIEVGSEQVDTVRTAHVIGPVSVQVPDSRTVGRVHNRSHPEMMLNVPLILEWNPVSIHKGQVRDARLALLSHCRGFRKALAKDPGQPLESLSTLFFNVRGRGIAGKKRALRMRVCSNPAGDSTCQPWMTMQRFVLRARQKQTRVNPPKEKGHA